MVIERVTHDSDGSEHAQAFNARQKTSVQAPMIDGKFPDYKRVLPAKPAGPPTLTINAQLLADLQTALSTNAGVSLWVAGLRDSIYVEAFDAEATGAVGVIMPLHGPDNKREV